MKKIAVVTIKEVALNEYLKQVRTFFSQKARVAGYSLDNNPEAIEGDIVFITSNFIMDTVRKRLKNSAAQIIHISSVFSRQQIDLLEKIPPQSRVLLVNSSKELVYDCMTQFESVVKTPLQYIPYAEQKDPPLEEGQYEYAVTFIEPFMQKDKVDHVIALGGRKIHPYVFEQAIKRDFEGDETLAQNLREYRENLIPLNFSSVDFMNVAKEWEDTLNSVIYLMEKGVIVLDDNERVKGFNQSIKSMFQINENTAYGVPVQQVPEFHEIFEHLQPIGEKKELQVFSSHVQKPLKISKRVIQFYSYKLLTLLFVEPAEEERYEERRDLRAKFTFDHIIGESKAIERVINIARRIAYSDSAVLLTGETGTGKEIFAHAIHNQSNRKEMPFIAVNCAAFPENLLESELFGYEAGAFTGALKEGKRGIFEIADKGTVFLDEIGDAPLSIQSKLLRVVQEKEIRRIGGEMNIPVNVRILSATNRDLKKEIEEDHFRKDLYYRLNTFSIRLPALRERREDIPLLAEHFLREDNYSYKHFTKKVLEQLMNCSWPGNIRELKNCVDYMGFMGEDQITEEALPEEYRASEGVSPVSDWQAHCQLGSLSVRDRGIAEFLLRKLYYTNAGRAALLAEAQKEGLEVTEHHLKRIMGWLGDEELIVQKKGRGGAVLSEKGEALFLQLSE